MRIRILSGRSGGAAGWRGSAASLALGVGFLTAACLTAGQVGAIKSQVEDLRTQVDQIEAALSRSREAIHPSVPETDSLYRQGYAALHRGDHVEAERVLRAFLAAHPQGEEMALARVWIAEALFARGLYRDAIAELGPATGSEGSSTVAAQALYDRALCRLKLGETELARQDLRRILAAFPTSDLAPLASARLEGL